MPDDKDQPQDTDQQPQDQQQADAPKDGQGKDDPDSFPKAYVQQLRDEAAGYRTKAKDRDDLAQRLHTVLVQSTGRLADPSDLPYDEAHLADEAALTAAIDALLAKKPHLESRTPRGDVGQGVSEGTDTVSLAGLLRARA